VNPTWSSYLASPKLPIPLRAWKPGERIELAGGGSSTIGDLFTNAKIPHALRSLWAVLADADDSALWIPGIADGEAMRIEGEPVLVVRIEPTSPRS
jgi:tRNA(Ile)-lysidine synthetase-like protein